MDTRDIRLSTEQIKVLNTILMKNDPEFSYIHEEKEELLDMFLEVLNNSDSKTLNDFTA
jgi:hypothetical protein